LQFSASALSDKLAVRQQKNNTPAGVGNVELVQTALVAAGIISICGVAGAAPIYVFMLCVWPTRAADPASAVPKQPAEPELTCWSDLVYRALPADAHPTPSAAGSVRRLTIVRPLPSLAAGSLRDAPPHGRQLRLLPQGGIEPAK
jgi:hypothetical protein